jgi:hypothetical protein
VPLVRFTTAGLATRCRRMGRAVESCEAAVVSRQGDTVTLDDTHEAFPRLGLGDMVATVTDVLHIPKCGGCRERQAALNAFGRRLGFGIDPDTGSAKSA